LSTPAKPVSATISLVMGLVYMSVSKVVSGAAKVVSGGSSAKVVSAKVVSAKVVSAKVVSGAAA
jgi:hypothetical protein